MVLSLGVLGCTVAGCGDKTVKENTPAPKTTSSKSGDTRTVTVTDQANDVTRLAHPVDPPGARSLDLRAVTLRRSSKSLAVTFRTSAPAKAPMIQTLRVYDSDVVSFADIDVRYLPGRKVTAVAAAAKGTPRPAPVRVAGRSVTVTAPLSTLSRATPFKWAATTSIRGKVVDRLPSTTGQIEFFPARG